MLFPYGHEDLRGRRWPVVTIVIIALNVVVFLGTHWTMDEENAKIAQATWNTILVGAAYPDVQLTPSQQKIMEFARHQGQGDLDNIKAQKEEAEQGLDEEQKSAELEQAQIRATDLGKQLDDLEHNSIVKQYEYYPDSPNTISLITANFLHAGWLHIIGNMWFLWLAGTVLEDAWGRPIYAVFYMVAGVVALLVQGAAMQHSIGGVLGASGAIAGAMGAFLVRFPKTKIKFLFTLFFGLRLRWKFMAPAYAMLPLWLGEQFLYAALPGGGVAYWAHIGGFGFGMIVAVALKFSGAEQKVNQAIEGKVSWSADPRVEKAGEALDQNQPDAAIGMLTGLVGEQPESHEAHTLLMQAYLKKQDSASAQNEAATLCKINLKAREMELALGNYEEYCNMGGVKFPSTEWMALCRHLEGKQNWQRAAAEYEKIAAAYKGEKPSIYALISAGRINLKQLGNNAEAARLYREVKDSPVPHHEWEDAIRKGLAECGADTPAPALAGAIPMTPRAPLGPAGTPATTSPSSVDVRALVNK